MMFFIKILKVEKLGMKYNKKRVDFLSTLSSGLDETRTRNFLRDRQVL